MFLEKFKKKLVQWCKTNNCVCLWKRVNLSLIREKGNKKFDFNVGLRWKRKGRRDTGTCKNLNFELKMELVYIIINKNKNQIGQRENNWEVI
jgi:hypothetical protein